MTTRLEGRKGSFSLDTKAELTDEAMARLLRFVVAGYVTVEAAAVFIVAWSQAQFERQLESNLETFFGNG